MDPVDVNNDPLLIKEKYAKNPAYNGPKNNISETKERQLVAALARNDLEDKYLRLREDHMNLKKLSREQEEKLKQMATKLLRLFNDKKKIGHEDQGLQGKVETSELIEDLRAKISNLEKTNQMLKNKLILAKHHLHSVGKKQSPYENIKPRVQTGLSNHSVHVEKLEKVQGISKHLKSSSPQPVLAQPRYGHSLLEEARIEKRELEKFVTSLQEQMTVLENEKDSLTEQIISKDRDFECQRNLMQSEISDLKNASLKEGAEMIRLEREVKEKSNKLVIMQGKYTNLEQMFQQMKSSNEKSLGEMEMLAGKLKQEQERNASLKNEIRDKELVAKSLTEKEQLFADVMAENEVLKETHEKLLSSTFDAERERRFRLREKEYQMKISQLESLTKADVLEKNELLDKLSCQKDENENLQTELKEWRINCYKNKELYEDLADKMRVFSKESNFNMEELQEAILLVKSREDKESRHYPDFLEKVDEESGKGLKARLVELESFHSETVNELEKTRGMLKIQYQLNRDFQKQSQIAAEKMSELQKDCDVRLKEYAQMLDTKTQRINSLEAQLKDIAYGTKQIRIQSSQMFNSSYDQGSTESEISYELERGQNVIEIHIGKLLLTNEGQENFKNTIPQMFVTTEFFEFELQSTPVVSGSRPTFNSTWRYLVAVDDFFLHYIQRETVKIEIHQAMGTDFRTIASGTLRMNELLEGSKERIHGNLKLLGINTQLEFGILDYWICLRVPMEHALRLYKERSKALGYMKSNGKFNQTTQLSQPDSQMNELMVTILRCTNLRMDITGQQPSSYAVYKFFTFADHDSEIISNSTGPEFNDSQTYPVLMSHELDSYLKTTTLDVYIFNDNEDKPGEYMGLTKIPLTNLAFNKTINGTFELIKADGTGNGTIDVNLKWLSSYHISGTEQPLRHTQAIANRAYHGKRNIASIIPSTSSNVITSKMTQVSESTTNSTRDKRPKKMQGTLSFNEDSLMKSDAKKNPTSLEEEIPNFPVELPISEKQTNSPSTGHIAHQDFKKTAEDVADNYESDEALFVEELRRTAEVDDVPQSPLNDTNVPEDTIFEEQISDEIASNCAEDDLVQVSTESVSPAVHDVRHIEDHDHVVSGTESAATSDSEGVVVSSVGAKAIPFQSSSYKNVSIEVSSLTLYENATIYNGPDTVQLYVAYRFLDEDPALLETPDSLPLPLANRPIYYNFKKVFPVDKETHLHQHQLLMGMLMPDHPSAGRLFFNIVTEPVSGEECEDAGIAFVDLVQILKDGRDMVEQDVEVVDFEGEVIGSLNVTVEAIMALRSFYE